MSSAGCISWRGTPIFLTEVLDGEYVGLEEVADGHWTLSFASVSLGRFDERTRTITALPPPEPRRDRRPVDAGDRPDRARRNAQRVSHSAHQLLPMSPD